MGNIGSHVNITSAWPGHQAKNQVEPTSNLFSASPSRADHAPGSRPANGEVMSILGASEVNGV
jgi:hypothetical protein